jgi:hypothetical protein
MNQDNKLFHPTYDVCHLPTVINIQKAAEKPRRYSDLISAISQEYSHEEYQTASRTCWNLKKSLMKKLATLSIYARKSLFEKAFGYACRIALEKKMLLTVILLTNVLIVSFSQKTSVLLSSYDSCHVRAPQQTAFALKAARVAGAGPMLRVAYVIPSNRTAQPDGVANLQHAIKEGQQFFKEQMEQNGFGAKTFVYETEGDGVTPLIHVVHVAETDEYLRGNNDIWGRTTQAAINAGISLWAEGEVWVVIPEAHLMLPDGTVTGGVALGAGNGSGTSPGVSMIGSNALPLFRPDMITDDTPYDGKVLPAVGPYPMKQDVTFAWFEGSTFSSIASSWLGALWHETGHAFGLPHDFRNDNNFHGNLMGNGLRGTRGSLFPEKYPQDYTRLEYASALTLNVSHYFNSDKMVSYGPALSYTNPGSVIPQQGLVHISFQASDPDSLIFADLRYEGNMVAEILLNGINTGATFAVPYYTPGNINAYMIFVYDKQGNVTYTNAQFNVPAGNNQAPVPFIRIDPPVPGLNQPIVLNAAQSYDVDHDPSSMLATWDVNNDGVFDTEPSTNKLLQYQYENPGNYLIRVKLTDPAGAQTISTAVSVKIPGEKKVAVEGFTLIDADKDVAVAELKDGLVIKQTAWVGRTFSVRANTSPGMIDQVKFNLVGPITHEQIDKKSPYALFGDNPAGNFIGRELLPGDYTLTATPFFGSEKGIALTVSFKVEAIIPGQPWIARDKTIGGAQPDLLYGAVSTEDGGYLLAGHSSSDASGDKSENRKGESDYWIVKIDAQYNKVWDKTIGGTQNDALLSIISTPDGGYLLGGYSISDISGDKSENAKGYSSLYYPRGDYWIVKVDNQGNKVWDKTLGGSGLEMPHYMVPTPDGGYLLGGFSDSDISGDKSENSKGARDFWLVKIDNQGKKLWDKTIGGNGDDELRHIIATADGGWLLSGNSLSNTSGDKSENSKGLSDYWIVKIDNQGNKLWDKTLGGSDDESISTVILTPDGSYLLVGNSRSGASGDKSENREGSRDYWIVKIDAGGNKVWDKTLGGPNLWSSNDVTSAVSTTDGGYLLAGQLVVKIDAGGNKVWDKTIGEFSNTYLISTISTILTPGGYLLAGSSSSDASGNKSENSKGSYDYWVVELKEPIQKSTQISSFSLINEKTGAVIREFKDSLTLDLSNLSLKNLAIQAHTFPEQVGSVEFSFDNKTKHPENVFPYTFTLPNHLELGTHTIVANVYSEAHLKGEKGMGLTAKIIVTNSVAVVSYDLVNTSGKFLRHVNDGDILYLDDLKAHGQTIVANTTGKIGSVKFSSNNSLYRVENVFPYTFTGNSETYFEPWIPQAGTYTIVATPHSQSNGGGRAGQSLTIHLTVKPEILPAVVSYDIVNTSGKVLRRLNEGDILYLDDLKHKGQTIVANTTGQVGSVKFILNNSLYNLENVIPYTFTGNSDTYFKPWIPKTGFYTLTATPYSKSNATGNTGKLLTIHLTVADKNNTSARMITTASEADSLAVEDVSELTIYPVPVENELFVKMDDAVGKDATLSILNLQGLIMYQGTYSQSSRISTVDFRSGVYVLQVVSSNGYQRRVKFIKK